MPFIETALIHLTAQFLLIRLVTGRLYLQPRVWSRAITSLQLTNVYNERLRLS